MKRHTDFGRQSSNSFAGVHAGLDQRDEVYEWLARAIEARDVHLVWLTQDAQWDPFRDDPRFRRLLERCDFMRMARPSFVTQ